MPIWLFSGQGQHITKPVYPGGEIKCVGVKTAVVDFLIGLKLSIRYAYIDRSKKLKDRFDPLMSLRRFHEQCIYCSPKLLKEIKIVNGAFV